MDFDRVLSMPLLPTFCTIYFIRKMTILTVLLYLTQEKINESHHMGNAGFPHQFSIARENVTKQIVWGEPAKLLLILFL